LQIIFWRRLSGGRAHSVLSASLRGVRKLVAALGLVGQLLDRISAGQKPKPPEVEHQDAYRSAFDEMPDISSSVKLL